jgi:uncharacterized damage-inducible protein DinB
MATVELVCEQWQDVRNGLIKEVELVPAEQMSFRAAPESRSIIELLQHIVESERVLSGEMCRQDTNFRRGFPAMIADFAGHVRKAGTKEAVLDLLRSSIEETRQMVEQFGDERLAQITTRFDGKQSPKLNILNFTVAHEMYHRGQLTVYERLLGIEPALTQFFRKLTGASS